MNTIHATVRNGHIHVPADLPDGTVVAVKLIPIEVKSGLDESEGDDSPEAIDARMRWLDTIETVTFAQPDAYDEQFRRMNVEAVRQQMFGESS